MSRASGNKSKAEKSGNKSANSNVASERQASGQQHDFIPSRFNLTDWISLTQDEEDQSFVGDLVDEIVGNVLNKCEEVHIKKQLMPYTLMRTKDLFLELIQWHFLNFDSGQPNVISDPQWVEEEEPRPSVIDSWAQGSVPVIVGANQESKASTPCPEVPPKESSASMEKSGSFESEVSSQPRKPEAKASTSSSRTPKDVKSRTSKRASTSKEAAASGSEAKTSGRATSSSKAKFTSKEEVEERSVVKSKSSTKGGRSGETVVYDEEGYIVQLSKLNVDQLPDARVNCSFRLVQAEPEPGRKVNEVKEAALLSKLKKQRRKGSLEANKRKKSILLRNLTERFSSVRHPGLTSPASSQHSIGAGALDEDCEENTKLDPYTPKLIEAMDASPGVVIREGGAVKRGVTEQQQMLLAGGGGRNSFRRRHLSVNIHDTARLRLLQGSAVQDCDAMKRLSVLPSISQRTAAN